MKQVNYYLIACLTLMNVMTSCSDDDDAKVVAITIENTETTEHTNIISFDKVAGAIMYDVDYAEKGNELKNIVTIDADKKLAYTFKELKSACDYSVKITAKNIKGTNVGEGTLDFKTKDALAGILGEWKYGNDTNTITYKFTKDGFGTYQVADHDQKIIMWSATNNKLTIKTYAKKIGGMSSTEVVDYEILNKSLIKIAGTTYFSTK